MNLAHRWLCSSPLWRNVVHTHLLPWALEDLALGEKILELGSGPGMTTEYLRPLVSHLTCLEINPHYASALAHRIAGLQVVAANAAAMPLAAASFDAVVCFTMLHHVPSTLLQDRLLSEVLRVLRPGGIFVGTDSLSSLPFRLFHLFDTIAPVNPHTFPRRLQAAGFEDIHIDTRRQNFRFTAHKPPANSPALHVAHFT